MKKPNVSIAGVSSFLRTVPPDKVELAAQELLWDHSYKVAVVVGLIRMLQWLKEG